MADTKISALTAATTPLAGTEVLPIVQSGVTKQVSVADLTAGRAVSALSLTLTNALTAANGGTGQSSYAVGDLLYASTTTALSKLADVATGNALISGGVGVAPSWGKVGLTTHVSGTLAVGNGGTGLSSVSQGDLLYGSAANTLSALAKNTSASRYLSNSGTSNNPAWSQVDLTNGVTGTLPIANGGTNATATPTNGGVAYGTGTAYAFTAAGTSNYLLQSAGAAAPTWSNALSIATLATSSTITPTGRTATYYDAAYKNAGTTMTWAYVLPSISVHLVTIYQQNDTNVGFAPGMYLVMRQGTQTNIVTIAAAGQVASVAIDGSYQFTATLSVSYNNIIYGSILRLI